MLVKLVVEEREEWNQRAMQQNDLFIKKVFEREKKKKQVCFEVEEISSCHSFVIQKKSV